MKRNAGVRSARPLSRGQVARLLGIAENAVAEMDGRQLHPARLSDRRWCYDVEEVRALLGRHGSAARPPVSPADGPTTAAVFELFEQGRSPAQVVIATKQTADIVAQLRTEYDRMSGSLLLSADDIAVVRGLLAIEAVPSSGELIAGIRRALERQFERGRTEGCEDAHAYGVVMDPATGVLRPVEPPPAARAAKADAAQERGRTP